MMSQSMGIKELEECRGPRSIVSTVEDVCRASKRSDNRVLSGREVSRRRRGGRYGGDFRRISHYNAGERFEKLEMEFFFLSWTAENAVFFPFCSRINAEVCKRVEESWSRTCRRV